MKNPSCINKTVEKSNNNRGLTFSTVVLRKYADFMQNSKAHQPETAAPSTRVVVDPAGRMEKFAGIPPRPALYHTVIARIWICRIQINNCELQLLLCL